MGDSQVEEVWRRLLQQGADEEPYSPPWERDNTTASDNFSLNTEDITEIHRRLGEFLSNFESIPRNEMVGYGESFSQGAHGFKIKDSEGLEHLVGLTGAELISKGNPIYHMAFEDEEADEGPTEPSGKWVQLGTVIDADTGATTTTYQWVSDKVEEPRTEVSEDASMADILDSV